MLILGDDVAFKIAVMQIKADVFECKAVLCELFDGELKKMHIIRFLMYLTVFGKQLFVDLKKTLVS